MGWGLGSDGATALMGFGEGSGLHDAYVVTLAEHCSSLTNVNLMSTQPLSSQSRARELTR